MPFQELVCFVGTVPYLCTVFGKCPGQDSGQAAYIIVGRHARVLYTHADRLEPWDNQSSFVPSYG